MASCRCGISDWRALRYALGVTQEDMGELLGISRRAVILIEKVPHRCPRRGTVRNLRIALQHPEAQRRLAEANYPNPFGDVPDPPPQAPEPKPVEPEPDDPFQKLLNMVRDS